MEMPARMGKHRDKKNSKDQNQNLRKNFFKKDVNSNKSEGRAIVCDIRENMKQSQKSKTSSDKSNKPPISSSVLATMAQLARQDKWIEYDVAVEEELNNMCNVEEKSITKEEKLTEWLESNKPSKILRSSGVGWICLTVSPPPPDPHSNASELEDAWDSLISQKDEKDEIAINDIRELAAKFSVTGGKWLLHVNSPEVDKVWSAVAAAVHAGHLGPNVYRAKVSPVSDVDDANNEHVIQVYNKDFTDEEEVLEVEASLRQVEASLLLEVEASLRQANLRFVLQYKPQVFSVLGIYRNNRWGLRPSIYQSKYEMIEERPVIESILEKSWFWNNAQGCGSSEGINKADERAGNDLGLSKKDDRIIQRPCNYYNDVGTCEFSSGHLSKSGFTERMHLCRYCFNAKGREEFHSELRCLEKSRTEQKTSSFQKEISQRQILENTAADVGKKGNVVARPCDHFNDVGSCKFISGHLSQSGFTRRLHICRLCFSMDGNERNHPEGKCDRRRNANTENLLSVINSLNQLKMAESRNGSGPVEGRSYNSRGGFAQIHNGREHENNRKDCNNGRVYTGTHTNYGKENDMPQVNKGRRNGDFQRVEGKTKNEVKGISDSREWNGRKDAETQEVGGRRSEKLHGELDQSTPRSRLYQNVSYGKERKPQKENSEIIRKDQKELGNLDKDKQQENDNSNDGVSNMQNKDEKKREKNELHGSKSPRKKLIKKEDSLDNKKSVDGDVDSDLNKFKSKKNRQQDKSETISKKESHSKGKKDKKNKVKVKSTVDSSVDHISSTDAKYEDILNVNINTKEYNSNKKESNATKKKVCAKNQSKEDSSTSTIEEKRPMPNIQTPDKQKENEKLSEDLKATETTSSQRKDKNLKDIKAEEMNPGKLSPGRHPKAMSTPSKYGSPRSTSEKGFRTPPRFVDEKFRNRNGFAENKFSERFPNPPTFVEKKFPEPPTFVEKKFSKPPPFMEKFSNPPPYVEKKFPNAPRYFERKFPVAPRFAEKFLSAPKFGKVFHNPTDYTKKMPTFPAPNFVKSARTVSSVKKQGKGRKPLHCPCPPYCTECLAIIKNGN